MKHILSVVIGLVVIFGFIAYKNSGSSPNLGLAVCTPTTTVMPVGHQESRTVLSAGARTWAVIQQPLNATNTVSLSLGGTAVAGQGYNLANATTSSYATELRVGYGTDFSFQGAITAITASASSTVNVIVCR